MSILSACSHPWLTPLSILFQATPGSTSILWTPSHYLLVPWVLFPKSLLAQRVFLGLLVTRDYSLGYSFPSDSWINEYSLTFSHSWLLPWVFFPKSLLAQRVFFGLLFTPDYSLEYSFPSHSLFNVYSLGS